MKKNRMMRLASVLLVCVLLTTSVISGTFAKYTSTATGSDSAKVAKWKIDVGTTNIAQTEAQTLTFNLFDTILDTVDSKDETHVNDGLIAPGTKGSFTVDITNNSEVVAKIEATLKATETNGNIPIQYSTTGAEGTWKDDLADLSITKDEIAVGGKVTVTVYWQWVYSTGDDGDKADTTLGIAAAGENVPEVKVEMTVTATQVD